MQIIQLPIYDPQELQALITCAVNEAFETKFRYYTPPHNDIYYTRKQTAELLNIALSTLHEYTLKGIIKAHRLGSRVRYKEADIETALTLIKSTKTI